MACVGGSSVEGAERTESDVSLERRATVVQWLVRETAVASMVKSIHGHACQICASTVILPSGPYVEGAHIRPLGRPYDGPTSSTTSHILNMAAYSHESVWFVR
jgi:putative restriction endonuclease